MLLGDIHEEWPVLNKLAKPMMDDQGLGGSFFSPQFKPRFTTYRQDGCQSPVSFPCDGKISFLRLCTGKMLCISVFVRVETFLANFATST